MCGCAVTSKTVHAYVYYAREVTCVYSGLTVHPIAESDSVTSKPHVKAELKLYLQALLMASSVLSFHKVHYHMCCFCSSSCMSMETTAVVFQP